MTLPGGSASADLTARSAVRIAVFTGDPSYAVRRGIVAIDDAIAGIEWLVLVHRPRKTVPQLLRSQRMNLRRNGWRWIPYQLVDVWQRIVQRGRAAPVARADVPGADCAMQALLARGNVRLLTVPDIHAESTLAEVRAFAPTLGLSLAAPILRRPLFSIPALGTLNLHKGRLPDFRGMPPAFWELWHDQRSVGCSVHEIDDKLDTGALIAETEIERPRHATVRGMQLQLDEVGVELMRESVQGVLAGTLVARPQRAGQGTTHRKPTLRQVNELASRLSPPASFAARLRRGLKDSAFTAAIWAHRLGLARMTAPRVVVLLYHRVSDDVRDNLTVGVEQFDRQMAMVARIGQVLSIEQVLDMGRVPRTERPLVAVTFDDGYLDNFAHAAPILRRHGIPAAFFVSTGIVNSDRRFPHDIRRGNPPIPMMTWEQLGAMKRWGFTIGSHTVSHIDCAAEPEATVVEELERSRDDLKRELGIDQPVFAYPYGGRRHMTAQRLELVRRAGYVGCLSAYGGCNIDTVDRFNVLRRGIDWTFSDRAFELEMRGIR